MGEGTSAIKLSRWRKFVCHTSRWTCRARGAWIPNSRLSLPVIPTATAEKNTNEPIPGYKLVKRIGAGGYGEVWTAEAPGELVKAIKFVYGLLDEDRAARELKALNRIKGVRHPFLLSLERIEVVEGQLLIVTELADCSLKDTFETYRKKDLPGITRDELLQFMRDAADALDYMSDQHSLQHLDVKPENLLREARRQRGLPDESVPTVCALDPDGDIVRRMRAEDSRTWPRARPTLPRLARRCSSSTTTRRFAQASKCCWRPTAFRSCSRATAGRE